MTLSASAKLGDVLAWEHLKIEEEIEEIESAARYSLVSAMGHFYKLKSDLERHMNWEESTLYPWYRVNGSSDARDLISILEIEHGRIQKFLAQIEIKILTRSFPLDLAGGEFGVMLRAHHRKEETQITPRLDAELGESEREEMYGKLISSPALPGKQAPFKQAKTFLDLLRPAGRKKLRKNA